MFGTAGADTTGTGGSGGTETGTGGTSSGGADLGGAAGLGTGGAAVVACGKSTGSDKTIDDFEDGDTVVKLVDGRNGIWATYNDASVGGMYSSHSPTAAVGHSGYGFCTDISGYKMWGANIVANMSSPTCGYDASPYTGVCFWVKGKVTAGGPAVFAVGTNDTVPVASGGACLTGCNAHYEHTMLLTDTYQQFCYHWADLTPPAGGAKPPVLDKAHIVQMEWKFPAKSATVSTDGSICIDDITFE